MTDQVACPRCQIGNLQAETGTYSGIHNGMLLSVPNMPVWKCDLCEYQEFDYDALTNIEALAGRFGMPDDPVRPTSKRTPLDSDSLDQNLPSRIKP
jgi:YgiT-type zinc finger domain-containing protein